LVGGDPTELMLGRHATLQQKLELRTALGLDQPFYVQYFNYLKQIVTFDFGRSYSTKQQVTQMILRGMPASLSLTVPAFILESFFAIIIAMIVAFYRGSFVDRAAVFLCVIGMSISSLAYILFGQYVFAYKLGWFPISGYSDDPVGRFQYVALPALIWVTVGLGLHVRVFRTFILDEVGQDYVRTARSKGLGERLVMFKHVLKNAMIPIMTYTVIEIPFLITGSFLLESFFGIPGLGSITIDAINNSDFPVIKAMTTIGTLLFIAGNLLTDVLYSVVDPRVRLT
jgi:peptide/nickel transport system permease protein